MAKLKNKNSKKNKTKNKNIHVQNKNKITKKSINKSINKTMTKTTNKTTNKMANKTPNKKLRVGILGATGMVGQRFISLLENHPWFEVTVVAASPRSAGKKYIDAVAGRWSINKPSSECGSGCSSELGQWVQRSEMPNFVRNLVVYDVNDVEQIKKQVDFVFSAVDMTKDEIRAIENKYAENDIPVVSNNSAHRWTPDVAMIIPEINPHHAEMIPMQRKNHGWKKGFIVVKPNCSIQSYMPVIAPLMKFNPKRMVITTMQSISGAGKTFETYPDIADNVIPFIGGEEEKSEKEPLKILGSIKNGNFVDFEGMKISAHCNRTPTSDGHMATVSIEFEKKPTREEILKAWKGYKPVPQQLGLPSAPDPVLIYREEENRPQTRLDRDAGKGMAISIGRLRPCNVFDYRFVALSHNTVRGAAGGAILVAELLYKKGYLG